MHNTFRTLGQQMGMQTIRAILPESIDVFINETINEKVRSVVVANSSTGFQDRVAIQDNAISPINYVRTLYRTATINVSPGEINGQFYRVDIDNSIREKVMFYTSFAVVYGSIDLARYGCRFIEGDKLYDTLRDYCNAASRDYPIVTMRADDSNSEYIEVYSNSGSNSPSVLDITFIELPTRVKWAANLGDAENCNLPEYTHNEIVELAVAKYFQSVGATTRPVPQN